MTPEKAKKLLDRKHFALYKLIYERFLASQMAEAKYNSTQMEIDNSGYIFKAGGRVLLFAGYTKIYQEAAPRKEDEDEPSSSKLLPDLKEGNTLDLVSMNKEQKFTKPPCATPTPPSSRRWRKRESAAPRRTRPSFLSSIRNI